MSENDLSDGLTHLDEKGRAKMVEVSAKREKERVAVASSVVTMSDSAFALVGLGDGRKGDAIQIARIAGIAGAKRTSDLIPLCHPLRITSVQVTALADDSRKAVEFTATVSAIDRTGVEMEAMTAASVAALTLYDMIKGVDRAAEIDGVRLLKKTGGKTGTYERPASK